jgi:hypothetical protein
VDKTLNGRKPTDKDVLGHRDRARKTEFLEHGANTERLRSGRPIDNDLLAFDFDPALIG